jgi:hypothetical protein
VPAPTRANEPLTPESLAQRLDELLDGLVSVQRALLATQEQQLRGVRTADAALVSQAVDAQGGLLTRLAQHEADRRALLARGMALPALDRSSPTDMSKPTVTALIARCAEARRPALRRRAEELRALVETHARQGAPLQQAVRSLLAHMEGLTRQVAARLSHAGTYGRTGAVGCSPAGPVMTGLDAVM